MELNKKDEQLIACLRNNGRVSISELARQLNLSRTAAQMRLKRLENNSVITGYGVRLSDKFIEGQVRALVMIKSPASKRGLIERALTKIPQLSTLYSVSGIYDQAAVVWAQSVQDLDRLIDQVGNIDGVEDTMSSVILSTKVDR